MTIKSTQNKFAMYEPTEDYDEDAMTITKMECCSQELKILKFPKGYKSLIELNCSLNELTWLPQMPASLEKLDCSINDITNLDGVLTLTKNLYYLNCGVNYLTHLPILPNKLKKLRCDSNRFNTWPTVLPATLTYLDCSCNNLMRLPFALPNGLIELHCNHNKLTEIPQLPNTLQNLDCCYNKIHTMPNVLPCGLKRLWCDYNKLTELHFTLPDCIEWFYCENNRITILPDFPTNTEIEHFIEYNPLIKNYPNIECYDLDYARNTPLLAKYINQCNGIMRCRKWLAVVNPTGHVFWEAYVRRCMHPRMLAPLLTDTDIDVDEFMTHLADSL